MRDVSISAETEENQYSVCGGDHSRYRRGGRHCVRVVGNPDAAQSLIGAASGIIVAVLAVIYTIIVAVCAAVCALRCRNTVCGQLRGQQCLKSAWRLE